MKRKLRKAPLRGNNNDKEKKIFLFSGRRNDSESKI